MIGGVAYGGYARKVILQLYTFLTSYNFSFTCVRKLRHKFVLTERLFIFIQIVGRILSSMQLQHGITGIEDYPEHLLQALREALALVGKIKCYQSI